MIKKSVAFLTLLFFFSSHAAQYRESSVQTLENGVTVVFVDADESDNLLLLLCVSAGSNDDGDKHGVANLLNYVFTEKLRENISADFIQSGSEIRSSIGHDQSIYYFYGKTKNLNAFIKNLGETFSDFSCRVDDLDAGKRVAKQQIFEEEQKCPCCARESMYWHSGYGQGICGDPDNVQNICEEDIKAFANNNHTNNRATVVIVGNVDKEQALQLVSKHFKENRKSEIKRLAEPPHHGSTTMITRYSTQTSAPIIEMYWRTHNYRKQKDETLALEIFASYLVAALQRQLVEMRLATAVSGSSSFWNYESGDFCLTVTLSPRIKVKEGIIAILTEVKNIADEDIFTEEFACARRKVRESSDVLRHDRDISEFCTWFAHKIGAGYSFDFLKTYPEAVDKVDLNAAAAQGKAIFKRDPCTIFALIPLKQKNAD
ncbi:MAG: insulinase family protein [Holosporaceae bacterium]|jgi:zinc protease|nr:insulinase family protein [Holosporaceae bacterium]